jgi:two-component system sensor histidine kinase KdpD
VCRAIAHAHGGDLTLRQRAHGGCSVECRLPVQAPPAPPQQELTP